MNAQVGIYNGENYNKTPGDQRKDLMSRVSVRVLGTDDAGRVGGFTPHRLRPGGASRLAGVSGTVIGMLSYRSKGTPTLAGEYARTKDRQDAPPAPATPTLATIDGQVLSFFGVFKIPERSRPLLIGRVDCD